MYSFWDTHSGKSELYFVCISHYLYLMCSQIPHEMASMLEKEDPAKYTFQSFRRTSATMAAEEGGSAMQLQDFFGWKSPNMPSG